METAHSPKVKSSRGTSASTSDDARVRLLAQLWLELDAFYGRLWDHGGGIDGDKFRAWLDGTHRLSVDQLRRGIEANRDRDSHYPPSLPEFRTLCAGKKRQYAHPQNCTDEFKAEQKKTAARILKGRYQKGDHRQVMRGEIFVYQVRKNGYWYDQPPQGVSGFTVREIYGDGVEDLRLGQPRHDDDSLVAQP